MSVTCWKLLSCFPDIFYCEAKKTTMLPLFRRKHIAHLFSLIHRCFISTINTLKNTFSYGRKKWVIDEALSLIKKLINRYQVGFLLVERRVFVTGALKFKGNSFVTIMNKKRRRTNSPDLALPYPSPTLKVQCYKEKLNVLISNWPMCGAYLINWYFSTGLCIPD